MYFKQNRCPSYLLDQRANSYIHLNNKDDKNEKDFKILALVNKNQLLKEI